MRVHQIGNMNVITYTGPVWSVRIRAKDLSMATFACQGLARNLDQLFRTLSRLTRTQLRISAGNTEIAKRLTLP